MQISKHDRQSGEGRIGFVISAIVLVLVAMAGAEWLPMYWRVNQLEDHLVATAEMAARMKIPRLKKGVMAKAEELNLPLDEDNLEIRATRGKIILKANYVVTLDLPLYRYDWEVRHDVERPLFSF